ncbi:MAG: LysM peptidoglycan-binding domain-containing protein, partial [Pseudonocardia sp.]
MDARQVAAIAPLLVADRAFAHVSVERVARMFRLPVERLGASGIRGVAVVRNFTARAHALTAAADPAGVGVDDLWIFADAGSGWLFVDPAMAALLDPVSAVLPEETRRAIGLHELDEIDNARLLPALRKPHELLAPLPDLRDIRAFMPRPAPDVAPSTYRPAQLQGLGAWNRAVLRGLLSQYTGGLTGRKELLARIWVWQGFARLPASVDSSHRSRLVAAGHIAIYRGIAGPRAAEWAQQFRTGDVPFLGTGVLGEGTNFAARESWAKGYADGDARSPRGSPGAMVSGYLHRDAWVMPHSEALRRMAADRDSARRAGDHALADLFDEVESVGIWAALNGVDVLVDEYGSGEHYLVQNRTAVLVDVVGPSMTRRLVGWFRGSAPAVGAEEETPPAADEGGTAEFTAGRPGAQRHDWASRSKPTRWQGLDERRADMSRRLRAAYRALGQIGPGGDTYSARGVLSLGVGGLILIMGGGGWASSLGELVDQLSGHSGVMLSAGLVAGAGAALRWMVRALPIRGPPLRVVATVVGLAIVLVVAGGSPAWLSVPDVGRGGFDGAAALAVGVAVAGARWVADLGVGPRQVPAVLIGSARTRAVRLGKRLVVARVSLAGLGARLGGSSTAGRPAVARGVLRLSGVVVLGAALVVLSAASVGASATGGPTRLWVQRGDTFNEIARALGVDPDALAAANADRFPTEESRDLIIPNEPLETPAEWDGTYRAQPGDSWWEIAERRFRLPGDWRDLAGANPDLRRGPDGTGLDEGARVVVPGGTARPEREPGQIPGHEPGDIPGPQPPGRDPGHHPGRQSSQDSSGHPKENNPSSGFDLWDAMSLWGPRVAVVAVVVVAVIWAKRALRRRAYNKRLDEWKAAEARSPEKLEMLWAVLSGAMSEGDAASRLRVSLAEMRELYVWAARYLT